MKNRRQYLAKNGRALWLAALLLVAFGGKEAHHFTAHRHDKIVKICTDARPNETHFHGEEYLPHECSLCDFTFSFFAFFSPNFLFLNKKLVSPEANFSFLDRLFWANPVRARGRAPPFIRLSDFVFHFL